MNETILPEYIAQIVVTALCLLSFHWLGLLASLPAAVYHVLQYDIQSNENSLLLSS